MGDAKPLFTELAMKTCTSTAFMHICMTLIYSCSREEAGQPHELSTLPDSSIQAEMLSSIGKVPSSIRSERRRQLAKAVIIH